MNKTLFAVLSACVLCSGCAVVSLGATVASAAVDVTVTGVQVATKVAVGTGKAVVKVAEAVAGDDDAPRTDAPTTGKDKADKADKSK